MSGLWQEAWFRAASDTRRQLWRGVEAQHVVATMRLVDTLAEQEALESILEESKPSIPDEASGLHYLLFTPFRYVSPHPSRFRVAHDKGVFYGADDPPTVAAELAHWRWKFLMDSDALRDTELVTEHTFFLARVRGVELDITQAPWSAHRPRWRDPRDYSACQRLATHLRANLPHIDAIRYESARREGAACGVVLNASALSLPGMHPQQTWTCKTTASTVMWAHERELLEFPQGNRTDA